VGQRQGTPIVDEKGELAGIITRSDLMKAMERTRDQVTVLQAGTASVVVGYPDELLRDAVKRMLDHGIGRLPIVERGNPKRLVGYLGRAGVMAARVRMFEEEHLRERGRAAR